MGMFMTGASIEHGSLQRAGRERPVTTENQTSQ